MTRPALLGTPTPEERARRLLRPLAADDARAQFWVRHVRVGVALTEISACVVLAYVFLADRPHQAVVLSIGLVVMAGSPLLMRLPMDELATGVLGPLLFYLWSAVITVVIVVLALLDGGADSPLLWLFVLTLTFAALAYPPLGVMLMGGFMVLAYVAVAAIDASLGATTVVVAAVLLSFTVMTAWVSRNHWDTYQQQLLLTERLAEVDRAREEFVATTSHELRTPVTSILGYIELFDDSEVRLNPDTLAFLDSMRRNAERLQGLSENLLVLSSWDTEKRDQRAGADQSRDADLVTVAERVQATMAPLAWKHDVQLAFELPDEPLGVSGSAEQLERAVLNLVSNAVKYTPEGGQVTCTLRRRGSEAVLVVRDTGIGMTQEDVNRLFTRFFRASSAREHSIPGVGLGLSIVHTIVTEYGGRIDVSSTLNGGTTFVVHLPCRPWATHPSPTGAGDAGCENTDPSALLA